MTKTLRGREKFEVIKIWDFPVLLTKDRVSRVETELLRRRFPSVFVYHLRGTNEDEKTPNTIELSVFMNFAGTVMSVIPLLGKIDNCKLIGESGLRYTTERMTLGEYFTLYDKKGG